MKTYDDLEPFVDAQVENRLGDSITYTPANGAPLTKRGFISMYGSDGGLGGADPGQRRWTVKISRVQLPGGPKPGDRLTHRKLGGDPWKPTAGSIVDDGKDYVFNIVRA